MGSESQGMRRLGDLRLAVVMPAATARMGGVQRFASELLPSLTELADVDTFRLHPTAGGSHAAAAAKGLGGILHAHRQQRYDAVLTTFHWPPRVWPVPTFGVVHDLRWIEPGVKSRVVRAGQAAVCRTWSEVFVPSDHVAADVLKLAAGASVVVVGEGTDHLDALVSGARASNRDGLIVLGGAAPHKRTALATRAAAIAARQLDCAATVIGGGATNAAELGVAVIEEPTDDEIAALLASARLAITGTAYEGFGLAVGEAMRAGVPVVWCDDSPLESLVRDGGIAAAPNAESMAEAVVNAWSRAVELSRAATLATRDLTWSRTAEAIVSAIEVKLAAR